MTDTKDDGVLRSFGTGATRDTSEGKLDFEGFLSPFVLRQFARYMNMNRLQSDGALRDSDNWQKGIPMTAYMKSLYRHFEEMWYTYRLMEMMSEHPVTMPREEQIEFIGAICGAMFNVMGYLHEWLKLEPEVRFDDDEPTKEMKERQLKVEKAEEKGKYGGTFEEYDHVRCTCDVCKDLSAGYGMDIWKETTDAVVDRIDSIRETIKKKLAEEHEEVEMIECPDCYEVYAGDEEHDCNGYDMGGSIGLTRTEDLMDSCTELDQELDDMLGPDTMDCSTCRYHYPGSDKTSPCRECIQKERVGDPPYTLWMQDHRGDE